MGMTKIPKGMLWAKITWQSKKKKKNVILLLLKLKDDKIVFIRDLEHFNPLLYAKTKT